MSNSLEYIFTADLRIADEAARKQGWHAYGRTGWIKPDGAQVPFHLLRGAARHKD
jgi:hypothetical protein